MALSHSTVCVWMGLKEELGSTLSNLIILFLPPPEPLFQAVELSSLLVYLGTMKFFLIVFNDLAKKKPKKLLSVCY